MSIPDSGEHHERAVEAMNDMTVRVSAARTHLELAGHGHALTAEGTNWGEARHFACRACLALIDLDGALALYSDAAAYHRSLREQGVVLVDLREVVGFVREWQDDWNEGAMVPPPADALERRFGGNERSDAR